MILKMKSMFNRAGTLFKTKYFLNFYYGEKLTHHSIDVIIKFLLARLAFISHVPLLLPNRYFSVDIKGIKFLVRLFNSPVTLDIAFGVYEYWLAKIFMDHVKEGMTILDIGAHHGYYALLSAKRMNDKGNIYAFEPDPVNCQYFLQNLNANKLKSIKLCPFALSDHEEESDFFAADGLGSLHYNPIVKAFNVEPEKISVNTQTLDQVVKKENIDKIDLIKIDVEGSELLVLKGAKDTLQKTKASILMDVDSRNNAERKEMFELLVSMGYKIYKVGRRMEPILEAAQLVLKNTNTQYQNVRSIFATKN